MPIHDWSRVDAGIFHHFHHEWISAISKALNKGILPGDYYALAEQVAGGYGPDVLTLQNSDGPPKDWEEFTGGVALATEPPLAKVRHRPESAQYAAKARRIAVRHTSDHRVVCVIEIVSPGNKRGQYAFDTFIRKTARLLSGGVNLLVLDLFPPSRRDPLGIHRAIWDEFVDSEYSPPADMTLTLAAYRADTPPEAFVEPTAVGQPLIDMPVFITPARYVSVPLEATYLSAWDDVPQYWRDQITSAPRT